MHMLNVAGQNIHTLQTDDMLFSVYFKNGVVAMPDWTSFEKETECLLSGRQS
jgi:hypothetical protein